MKKIAMYLPAVLIAALMFSCEKNTNNDLSFEASRAKKVKLGEPVVVKMTNIPDGTAVNWSVMPKENSILNVSKDGASIVFSHKGNYTVKGEAGNIKTSQDIIVDSTIYNPVDTPKPVGETYVELVNDEITITPKVTKDSSIVIMLSCITKNEYKCLNNRLTTNTIYKDNERGVEFLNVAIPSDTDCLGGKAKAWYNNYIFMSKEGFYLFSCKLGNKIYNGSFTIEKNKITFSWPYTEGVIFTTKEVTF